VLNKYGRETKGVNVRALLMLTYSTYTVDTVKVRALCPLYFNSFNVTYIMANMSYTDLRGAVMGRRDSETFNAKRQCANGPRGI